MDMTSSKLITISLVLNGLFILLAITAWFKFQVYWKNFVERHIERRVTLFDNLPPCADCLVFVGDSIIEGANWAELLETPKALNRGIASDTSEGVLGRLEQIYALKPVSVFLMIGVNDLNFGVEHAVTVSNFSKIFDGLDKNLPETIVHVQSVLPINKDWVKKNINTKIPTLHAHLREEAQKRGYQI